MRTIVLLAAALLCVVCSTSADARPRHHHRHHHHHVWPGYGERLVGQGDCWFFLPCDRTAQVSRLYRNSDKLTQYVRPMNAGLARVMAEGAGRAVSGRPRGCPRAFCGCGASLYLFGKIVPSLNLAANWLRFPRAEPAPGMVAARRHHVFVLVRHIQGPIWLAHDSNSGRHRTRVHPRSIAGYAIVNPKSVRFAGADW